MLQLLLSASKITTFHKINTAEQGDFFNFRFLKISRYFY